MVRRAYDFLKQVFTEFSEDDCFTLAAALAYYTVFSLPPLLVLVISIAGVFVTPEEAVRAVHAQFETLVGAEGARPIADMIAASRDDPSSDIATRIFGVVVLVFGATGVMVQLQASLNRAWDVQPKPGALGVWTFVLKRLLSFAMILGIAFLLLVSLVLSAVASAIVDRASFLLPAGLSDAALGAVDLGASLVVITTLFTLIYKFLPEARIRWRDVVVGALGTAVLFTLGKFAIGVYLGNSDIGSAYGAASSLAVLFVWVYYSSALLLLGAEFTQVWAKRFGAGVEPAPHAEIASEREARETCGERGLDHPPTPSPA